MLWGFPDGSKESLCNAGSTRDKGSVPKAGKIPWSRKWLQSMGSQELDMTEGQSAYMELVYSVVLLSGLQHSGLGVYIYIFIFQILIYSYMFR